MRWSALRLTALVAALAVLASGCAELLDLNDRAMVVGVGLDAAPAPAAYRLTAQFIRSGAQGGGSVLGAGGPASAASQAVTLTGTGSDVAEAFRRLRDETARFIDIGNLSLILVGDSLARQGILAPLDYFVRSGGVAESTQIGVVRGPASAVFEQKELNARGGAALPLFQFLNLGERASFPVAPNPLWRFLAPIYSHNRSSYAPLLEPSPTGQPFRLLGVALFLRGRMVGQLDGYDAAVFDWLVKPNGFPDALVRLPGSPVTVALRVDQSRRSVKVLGPADVALTMRLGTNLREGNGIRLNGSDLTPLERAAAAQIHAQVRRVLGVLQRDGTDVLHISDAVWPRYPGAAADWPATFSRLRLHLRVSVRIYSGGRKT